MSANKRNLNVALNLTANTKGLVKGLDVAEKGLGDVEKGAKALGKSGKTALVPMADALAKVSKETDKLGKTSKKALDPMADSLARVSKEADKLGQTSKKALDPMADSLAKVSKEADKLGKTSKRTLAPVPETLEEIAKASDKAGTSLEKSARRGANAWQRMGRVAKDELNTLGQFKDSTYGQLGGLGVGFGVGASVVKSAQLDKGMTQLQLTTGGSQLQSGDLRKNLLATQTLTGQSVDRLKLASDALGAGGLTIPQIKGSIEPLAKAMAVSTTDPAQLAKAVSVGSTFFDIDLTKPEEALKLLDKMTVAGRAGFAELEHLPDIFAKIGPNAKSAGLGLEQTLAMVETLSKYEPNADRLGTLTDSTLRLFTNYNYLKEAQSATKVSFFDKKGARRDPMEIIKDIKVAHDKLKTDKQRSAFLDAAFGKADQDTAKGMKNLLSSDALLSFEDIKSKIANSQGTIQRDFEAATNNAVDQLGRLSGALRTTTDMLAGPVNDAFTNLVKKALAPKAEGGYGLTGGDIMGGAAAGAAGLYVASRLGGAAVKKVIGSMGGLAKGVTVGKTLEETVGVTPVYVVNMPDSLGGAPLPGGLPGTSPMPGGLPGISPMPGKTVAGTVTSAAAPIVVGGGLLAAGGTALNYGVNGIMDTGASWFTGQDTNFNTMMLDLVYGKKTPAMGPPGAGIQQIGAPWEGSGDFGDRIAEALKKAVTNAQTVPVPLMKLMEPQEVTGTITIETVDGKSRVSSIKSTGPLVLKSAYTGPTMRY